MKEKILFLMKKKFKLTKNNYFNNDFFVIELFLTVASY